MMIDGHPPQKKHYHETNGGRLHKSMGWEGQRWRTHIDHRTGQMLPSPNHLSRAPFHTQHLSHWQRRRVRTDAIDWWRCTVGDGWLSVTKWERWFPLSRYWWFYLVEIQSCCRGLSANALKKLSVFTRSEHTGETDKMTCTPGNNPFTSTRSETMMSWSKCKSPLACSRLMCCVLLYSCSFLQM